MKRNFLFTIFAIVLLSACETSPSSPNVPYTPKLENPGGEYTRLKVGKFVYIRQIDGISDRGAALATKGKVGYVRIPSGKRTLTIATWQPGWSGYRSVIAADFEPGAYYELETYGRERGNKFYFDFYLTDELTDKAIPFEIKP